MPTPEEAPETNSSRLGSSQTRYNLRNRDSIPASGVDQAAFSQPRQSTPRTRKSISRGTGTATECTKSNIDTDDAVAERRANVVDSRVTTRVTTTRTTPRVHSASTERPLEVVVHVDDAPRRVSTRRKPRPVSAVGISSGPASATRSGRASKRKRGQQKENVEQSEHRVHGEDTLLRRPTPVRERNMEISMDHTQNLPLVNPGTLSASDSESRTTEAEKTPENIDRWRKVELVYECRRRNLSMTGTKKELKQRIVADIHQGSELPGSAAGEPDGAKEETIPVVEGVRIRRSERAQQSATGTVPSRTDTANDVVVGSVKGDDGAAAQPEEDIQKDDIEKGDTKKTDLRGKGEVKGAANSTSDKPGEQTVVCGQGNRHDDLDESMGDFDASYRDAQDDEGDRNEKSTRTSPCLTDRKQVIGESRGLEDDKVAQKKYECGGNAADVKYASMNERTHFERNISDVGHGARRSSSIAHDTGVAEQVQAGESVVTAVLDGMGKESRIMQGTPAAIKEATVEQETEDLDESGDTCAGEIRVACNGVPGEDENVGIESEVRPEASMLSTHNLLSAQGKGSDSRIAQVGSGPGETLVQAVQQDSCGNNTFWSEVIASEAPLEDSREKAHRRGCIREIEKGQGRPLPEVSHDNDVEICISKLCEPIVPSSAVGGNGNDVQVISKVVAPKEPSTGLDDCENDPGDVLQSYRAVAHEESDKSIDAVALNGSIIKDSEGGTDQGYSDGVSRIPRNAGSGEVDERDCARDLTNIDICYLPGNDGGLDQHARRNVHRSPLPGSDEHCEVPSSIQQEALNAKRKAEDIIIGSAVAEEIAHDMPSEVQAVATGEVVEIAATERGSLDRTQSDKESSPSQGTNQEQVGPGTEDELIRRPISRSLATFCHPNVLAADKSGLMRSHSVPVQTGECFRQSNASEVEELAVGSVSHQGAINSGLVDGAITFSESPLPSPRPFDQRDVDVKILSSADGTVHRHLETEMTSQLPQEADAPNEMHFGRHGVDALQFTEAEPPDPGDGLTFSGTDKSGRMALCSGEHLRVSGPHPPGSSHEEGIHLGGMQNTDFETLNCSPDQETDELEQMAQVHAHSEAAVGNSLSFDTNVAPEHIGAAAGAQGSHNLHMQGGPSADELSSDDNEESFELNGEESGGNGDPVDDVVANSDSSSAADEDMHSGDSRSSQGSNPDAAESDSLSPGGSLISGQPSCPSPRSGASSGQQEDEGSARDVIAAPVADGSSQAHADEPVDEVMSLSCDDGDIWVPAHPDSDGTRAAEVGAHVPEVSDSAQEYKGLAEDRQNICAMRSASPSVARKAKLERDMHNVREPNVADMIDHNQACTTQEDLGAVRRSGAAGISVDSARVARDMLRTHHIHPATCMIPDGSAAVVASAHAALADVHGDVPQSLVKGTQGMTAGLTRNIESLPLDKATAVNLTVRRSSQSTAPQGDPRAPPPSPLYPNQILTVNMPPPSRSVFPRTGAVCLSRSELRNAVEHGKDNSGSCRRESQPLANSHLCLEKHCGTHAVKRRNNDMPIAGTTASLERPMKRQKTSPVLVPVKAMPSPALTLRNLKPAVTFRHSSKSQEAAVSRSLDFGTCPSNSRVPLLERLARMEEKQACRQFTAFRDTIRDRIEQETIPFPTSKPVSELFHIGSVSTKARNISQLRMQTRAKPRVLQSRRAWDSDQLAAESLRRTQEMVRKVSAWQTAPSPFSDVREAWFQ